MTEGEFNDVVTKLAEIEGTLDAASFIVSLPRFSEEERQRQERMLVRQMVKVRSVIDRIREIQNREYAESKARG
jgi:hypothetical protein